MVAIFKYTQTTKILWRKRDGAVTLSRGERPTLALTGLYCFSRPLTSKTVLLYYAKVFLGGYLLQTKERMSLSTSKKDICNVKGEMVKPTMFHTWTV